MWDNPWMIGIVGSLIASIIFTTVVNLLSRKGYNNNVKKANYEIVNLLMMETIEEKIPKREVVEALINSTAKKYSIRLSDINSINDIYDDLIRTVYETNFIQIDKKRLISDELSALKIVENETEKKVKQQRPPELFELRRTKLYLYMFVIVSVSSMYRLFENEYIDEISLSQFKNLDSKGIAFLVAINGLLISFVLSRYGEYRFSKRRNEILKNK